jgi:uncharacterized protein (DUF1501 family)
MFGIGAGGIPPFMARAAESSKASSLYKKKKVLVCIFQRGAMDGLMAVTPFNDTHLRTARPDLFITPSQGQGAIDIDGRFALHPAMKMFEPMFREKTLAIVHGMGSPNKTRSHFDAQDYMESGTPFDKKTISGWLNRASGLIGQDATPFRAVSLTSSMPRSLNGDYPALAIRQKALKTCMTRHLHRFSGRQGRIPSTLLRCYVRKISRNISPPRASTTPDHRWVTP